MKKMIFLLLSVISFSIFSMEKAEAKRFPPRVEALSELTDKSTGCSEDQTDRAVKYTHAKDIARQKKYKPNLENFLQKMRDKYSTNLPAWVTQIDPEGKPFETECRDVCDFTPDGQYKMSPTFWAHCSNLSKSAEPLSQKEQALLNFIYDSVKMESDWLEWRSRIITGKPGERRQGQRHAFEKTIGLHFERDEYGNIKSQFNKKEMMWEPIVESITVHEHLNSPYFKRINEKPYEFDVVNVANAYENENYHKELMFMERQLLKMKLFNTVDREKLEKELDKAWDEKEKALSSWSVSSLLQQLFKPATYAAEQKKKQMIYEANYANYQQQRENAQINLDGMIAAEERLEQEIQSFKDPQNRSRIARACPMWVKGMKKVDFDNLQNARDLYLKE